MVRDDCVRAWRSLRRSPGFAIAAITMLALGIGANAAIFSVVRGTLLRPLPYADSDQLVQLFDINRLTNTPRGRMSAGDYVDFRARHSTIDLSAYVFSRLTVQARGRTEQVAGLRIMPNLFEVLGTRPLLGRVMRTGEDQDRVAVLSHRMWHRTFDGDSSVIGATLTFNERPYRVIGVMPAGFSLGQGDEYWIPFNDLESTLANPSAARGSRFMSVVGRLRPGVTVRRAQQDLSRLAQTLESEHRASNTGHGVAVVPIRTALTGDVSRPLALLTGAAALVLLIACANLANLLLSRFASRKREIAILCALGATHIRLIRQTLIESLMLAAFGALAGVIMAAYGTGALLALSPTALPQIAEVHVDGWVVLFAAAVSAGAAVVFGVMPTALVVRADPAWALKESGRSLTTGRGARRAQRSLVVIQTAVATMLLIGAGLLIRSSAKLNAIDPGFGTHNVVVAGIVLGGNRYDSATAITRFYETLFTELRAIPGIESIGATSALPTAGTGTTRIRIVGHAEREANPPTVQTTSVSDDYFSALQIPLVVGRWFGPQDRPAGVPVVVLGERLAATYWRTPQDAIGAQVRLGPEGDGDPQTVIGVVGDVRQDALTTAPEAIIYTSYRQARVSDLSLTIRTAMTPTAVNALLRPAVARTDRAIPLTDVRRFEDVVTDSVSRHRFLMLLLGLFAALAIVLAASGSYSAARYSVVERMPEFGVRMAIGATRGAVLRSILERWLATVALGLVLGVLTAVFATRIVRRQLFEVTPLDPVSYSVASLLLVLVTVIATLEPAVRASRANPVDVLRRD